MRVTPRVWWIGLLSLAAVLSDRSLPANAAGSTTTRTQTSYRIPDELASSYNQNDLRAMARRLNDRARNLEENARRFFINLLDTKGKSRAMISRAKEQAQKLKDQQRVRNRMQQDRVSDLRQKNLALSRQRADLKQKSRHGR